MAQSCQVGLAEPDAVGNAQEPDRPATEGRLIKAGFLGIGHQGDDDVLWGNLESLSKGTGGGGGASFRI